MSAAVLGTPPNLRQKWGYTIIRRDQVNNGLEGTGNTYNNLADRFCCLADAEKRLEEYTSGRQHHQAYEIVKTLPDGCLIL